MCDFTGLPREDLVTFRPERLVVHELLIRVTANISVPDGQRYEDLGINFREITDRILSRHIEPHMAEIVQVYDDLNRRVRTLIEDELLADEPQSAAEAPRGLLARLGFGGNKNADTRKSESLDETERRRLDEWRRRADAGDDALTECACRYLVKVAEAIRIKHGRLAGEPELLTKLVADMVCNDHGSEMIGGIVEPYIREAVAAEGYRLLPAQDRPVVMNVKGASASGKSTMRPLQKKLAAEIGVEWSEFALISPDIWRKYLLDYDSLGEVYKYAGTCTGHELRIVDQKIDRYMAEKAKRGEMSHLLIDRFRFDSFAPESEEEGSNLLTRFGELIYMFFMITPPDATVERAWERGLKVGRFKAVDDLLDHNVEAYTGMPQLFFTWALRDGKTVHYEFLDNSVAKGERPRTVAFGWNDELNVLDIKCLLDVDRYRKINIDALAAVDVYPAAETMDPSNNTDFLRQCARLLPAVNFLDSATGRIYARIEAGELIWTDPKLFAKAVEDEETRVGFLALAPDAVRADDDRAAEPRMLDVDRFHTLGEWGAAAATSNP